MQCGLSFRCRLTNADAHAIALFDKALDLEVTEVICAAKTTHQRREACAKAAPLRSVGQHGTGCALATGADQLMQPVFHHDWLHRREVDDLMAPWCDALYRSQKVASTVAAVGRMMVKHLIATLGGQ
jgi:hypothetical protein